MKKLIAVSALTAAFAAFAENTVAAPALDFESVKAGTTPVVEETGGSTFWNFVGSGDDGSLVQAYAGSEVAKPAIRGPIDYTGDNTQFLALSTEGGILWRGFGAWDGSGETATAAKQEIPETGLYVDTLVQFTPTEDGGTPELGTDDKLAIWLNVSTPEGSAAPVTNLCVLGTTFDWEGHAPADPVVYKITNKQVEAGKWYRLTVKAIANIAGEMFTAPGFKIYLDGTELISDTSVLDDSAMEYGEDYIGGDVWADIQAKKIFGNLLGQSAAASLTAVGFKGSGAIDDLVLTTEDPFATGSYDFTLNWPDGMTPVAYTINGGDEQSLEGEKTGFKVPDAKAGDEIVLLFRNTDGATKKFTATASESLTSITAEEFTYGWSEYLGDAVDGAYTIDDATDLGMFQKGVNNAKLATADETFKLTADVELTEAWPGVGVYNVNPGISASAFHGTFDGAGHRISNVVMADTDSNNYRGFFTQLEGATVKDLTVVTTGFGANPPSGEYGAAAVAGYAYRSTLQRCVAEGTITSGTHNVAGIVIRVRGSSLLNCTNKVNITGNYTKVAGIAVLTQNEAAGETTLIDGCVNEGTITCANGENAGRDGCAGILAYVGNANVVTIKDCENKGSIVKGANCSASAKTGQIVAYYYRTLTFAGNNKGKDDQLMISTIASDQSCACHVAIVDGSVATLINDSAVAAGTAYKVMAPSYAPTIELAADETISFNTALATFTDTGITAATGAELTSDKTTAVWTYSAAASTWPTDDDWAQGEDVDDDVKAKFNDWKANVSGGASTAGAAKAFLWNVAPGDTLPELKIESITVNGETATVVVSASGVNLETGINGVLYVDSSDDLATWSTETAELPASFADGKATFTVTAGKFMKAKIGFKAPAAQ